MSSGSNIFEALIANAYDLNISAYQDKRVKLVNIYFKDVKERR